MRVSSTIPLLALSLAFPVFAAPKLGQTDIPKAAMAEVNDYFKRSGPKPGTAAPDFELERARGGSIRASDLWKKRPVLITTGSYSCPQFRFTTDDRVALYWEFSDRVDFVIIYTQEAHCADGSSPYTSVPFVPVENKTAGIAVSDAKTYEERVSKARACRRNLKLLSEVVVDTMDNSTWKKYGSSPNCGYLIAPGGTVVLQQGLFDAAEMRSALLKLLGEDR